MKDYRDCAWALRPLDLVREHGRLTLIVEYTGGQPLNQMIAASKFRADLNYRLNVFPISVPALRELWTDIPLLVQLLLELCAKRINRAVKVVPTKSMEVFFSTLGQAMSVNYRTSWSERSYSRPAKSSGQRWLIYGSHDRLPRPLTWTKAKVRQRSKTR
ncbi:MAG: hypothetical protein ABSE48_11780 [Verrucomicrobiota bacterium]